MMRGIFVAMIAWMTLAGSASSVVPSDVVLLVNRNSSRGQELAEFYCQQRAVPTGNIISLDLPIGEDITRRDYDEKLVMPLRKALLARPKPAKVLLLIFGMPLRVGPEEPTAAEKAELEKMGPELTEAQRVAELRRRTVQSIEEEMHKLNLPMIGENLPKLKKELAEAEKQQRTLEEKLFRLQHRESEASVDSELMQLWWREYPKHRWIINPLYWQVPEPIRRGAPPMMMTARLDAPSAETVKRMITDAIWAEQNGLKGLVYVDARNIAFDPAKDVAGTGYGGYDESMREMAALLHENAKMPVILDNRPELFAPLSCPDCALYCGWYSVKKYIHCCKFNRGAVAWHLASLEAISLRNPQTQWCGNLLADGACATLGAVAEPYTVAFPKPEEFFGFLASGEYCLVECYARSIMISSWMITLVGDPLYNPYKNSKRISLQDVKASPKGSRFAVTFSPPEPTPQPKE